MSFNIPDDPPHTASKVKGLAWLFAVVLLGAGLAFGMSPLVRIMPWRWELGLARMLPQPMAEKVCRGSPENAALLDRLVARLYPVEADDGRISIDVQIVDDPAVNAYAMLGGHIFVNQGLLDQAMSADELAGVLSHEMEHVKRRHIFENVLVHLMTIGGLQLIFTGQTSDLKFLNYFLGLSFTRNQEAQADEGGLLRLQAAHVDNHGFGDFFRRMQHETSALNFFSDHPDNRDRLAMVAKFTNENTTPIMSAKEWASFSSFCE